MPRRAMVPKYGLHKASGQAVCYVNRKPVYLGPFDSTESRRHYGELLARLAAATPVGGSAEDVTAASGPITVAELLLKYVAEELGRYRTSDGKPSKEQDCIRGVIRITREMFGETSVAAFGPLKLRSVRSVMVEKGWTRRFVNKQASRLRAIFRWGISWELVPSHVAEALASVRGLKPGETKAPESVRRTAVPAENIEAVRKKMYQRNRDLIDLLLATAARPSELLKLTTADIDQTGEVWEARLKQHKTAWREQERTLYFGPKAQTILKRYLQPQLPEKRLFPVRTDTFSQSLMAACKRAGVPHFTPYHLRHTAATRLRDEYGVEVAAAMLGHRNISMTEHYSHGSKKQALAAAAAVG